MVYPIKMVIWRLVYYGVIFHVLPTLVICGDANSQQIARPEDGRALGPKVGSHREDTPEKMRKTRDE